MRKWDIHNLIQETKALDKVLDESVNELLAIAEFMFDWITIVSWMNIYTWKRLNWDEHSYPLCFEVIHKIYKYVTPVADAFHGISQQ